MNRDRKGIIKNCFCLFKIDTVFSVIFQGFVLIPFKDRCQLLILHIVSVFNEGGTNGHCRARRDLAQSSHVVKRHLGQRAGLL